MKNAPPINQIFEDLDKLRDWCRINYKPFNESYLYNEKSEIWKEYKRSQKRK